ncbi:MAG TPA: hypothetical protein VK577_28495, partial [Bradyrhizobium sp.]|nr:hypothetical protein [Bradyrhizobium sp.]
FSGLGNVDKDGSGHRVVPTPDHPGCAVASGNDSHHLDENRARPYSRAHDQRRDHSHRSPPPYRCGMGGHLRLRYQPLPPDPVRGTSFPNSAI